MNDRATMYRYCRRCGIRSDVPMDRAFICPDCQITEDDLAPMGDWVESASCAQVGGDAWHPSVGGSVTRAKQICGRCVVRAECLAWAMENDTTHDRAFYPGIWGGLSYRERARLRGAA